MCVVQRSEIWAKFVDTIWVSPLWLSPFLVISLQFPTVVVAPNFVLWFLMQRKTRFLSKFWLSCVYKSLQNGKLFQWHFFLSDIHSLPNLSLVTLSVFREFFFFLTIFPVFIIVDCEKFSPLQMISTLSSIKHTRLNIVVRIILKENVQFKQRFERREGFSQSDSFFFFFFKASRQTEEDNRSGICWRNSKKSRDWGGVLWSDMCFKNITPVILSIDCIDANIEAKIN